MKFLAFSVERIARRQARKMQISSRNSMFGSKGFTLIELIMFIIIASIFVPLTFVAFSSALKESMTPENVTANRLAAEQVIELTAKQIVNPFPAAYPIPTPTTCTGIAGCTVSAVYKTFDGSTFGDAGTSVTDYVLITADVQGITVKTLVTKHAYP